MTAVALPVIDVGPLVGHGSAYGDYLLGKVSKVFPQLRRDVLE